MHFYRLVATLTVAATVSTWGGVREDFAHPPARTRLQCWYHWTNSGLTEDCLAADFQAMGALGIGTAHVFIPSQTSLPPNIQPLSDAWWKLWEKAIQEAKKNNITLGFHNCPGWSSSGGPWITPECSMKMLVSSAVDVPALTGKLTLPQPLTLHNFYRDVGVFAFPSDKPQLPIRVTGDFTDDFAAFQAHKKSLSIPVAKGEKGGEIVLEYATPFVPTTLLTTWDETQFHLDLTVLSSHDGQTWQTLLTRPYRLYNTQLTPKALPLPDCPKVRFFKLRFTPVKPPHWVGYIRRKLAAVEFSSLPLVADIDNKNSASTSFEFSPAAKQAQGGIARTTIQDLTDYFDGTTLNLTNLPPAAAAANWRIVRVGYTTTGKCCAPAPSAVRGLECDKLARKGLDAHWPHMPLKMITTPGAKDTVRIAIIDSWEVGGQNWTEDFPAEFARLRGYALRPWLLAMAGYVLDTEEVTAKFLYDVQRTVSDLMATNYYDYFAEKCHALGIACVTESYGGPFDNLRCFQSTDIPTGEFWLGRDSYRTPRLAASAGHLNGRVQIAAESFTTMAMEGRWQITPHELRVNGDHGWLDGISQLVYHSYLQQPFAHAKPGFSLGPHGTQLNRHTTWWPEGHWWATYVQRGQVILQSGQPQADMLVLAGESNPNNTTYLKEVIDAGYNYDYCGCADLLKLTATKDGGVAMPGQRPYPLLFLGSDRYLTLATLLKVKDLLAAGARIAGQRLLYSPSLADDPQAWQQLHAQLWSGRYPNLKCVATPLQALKSFALRPPLESPHPLKAIRRVIEGRDFYFVLNAQTNTVNTPVSFAARGRPERWDAKTGTIHPLPWYADAAGRVKTHLSLRPDESCFVSFRTPHADEQPATTYHAPHTPAPRIVADWSSDWQITSFTGPCAPHAPCACPQLQGWNESTNAALKYFAGRAVYEKRITLPTAKHAFELDLGEVYDVVNVSVNGSFLGCLWESPYRIQLPAKYNGAPCTLRLEVINTWPNRLIGDAKARAAGAIEKSTKWGVPEWVLTGKSDSGTGIYTWCNWLEGYAAADEPRKAGLLGPVRLLE